MELWDKLDEGAVTLVYHRLYDVFSHHGTVIVLSRLLYWFKPMKNGKSRLKVEREGKRWYRCPRSQIAIDCKISPKVFRLAQKKLIDAGILEVQSWFDRGEKCHHYTLNLPVLEALLDGKTTLSEQVLNCPLGQNTGGLNCPSGQFTAPPLYKGIKTCIEDLPAHGENTQNTGKGKDKDCGSTLPMNVESEKIEGVKAMATAHEILAAKEKKESVTTIKGTQDTMALRWVKEVHGVTGEFCPPLTMKEKGMLGRVAKSIGKEKALTALQQAIRDWLTFTHRVKNSKGVQTAPAAPSIGFFVQHYGVLFAQTLPAESFSMFKTKTQAEIDAEIDAWNAKVGK